jgi:hypothetical protein
MLLNDLRGSVQSTHSLTTPTTLLVTDLIDRAAFLDQAIVPATSASAPG